VCKIPPLPEQYLAIWNNNGLNSSLKTATKKEISKNLENKTEGGSDKDVPKFGPVLHKQHEHTSVSREKKRTFDSTYVNTQIKTLSPRETPKIKKKKYLKQPK
jgi:hypothetical protein